MKAGRFKWLCSWQFVACVGIVLSLLVFLQVRKWESRSRQETFNNLASDRAETIMSGMENALELLQSVRQLYASSQSVEREEFHEFVKRILEMHPEILEFRWLQRVSGEQRQAFVETARAEGLHSFEIYDFENEGKSRKPCRHAEAFPVYYIEPCDGDQQKILGLDASSIAERYTKLSAARDTGRPAMAPEIGLYGKFGYSTATRIFLPVYQNGLPHQTVEERRKNLSGFLVVIFHLETMIDELLQDKQAGHIDTYIYDPAMPASQRLIAFDSSLSMESRRTPVFGEEQLKGPLKGIGWKGYYDIADTRLTFVCRPTNAFLKQHRIRDAWTTLGFCLLVTFGISLYLKKLRHRSVEIEGLVTLRTRELKESQQKMKAIFDQAYQFLALLTPDGNLIEANQSMLEFSGVQAGDVLKKPLWETPWWNHPHAGREKLRQAIQKAAQGVLVRFETTYVAADGSEHRIAVSLKSVTDAQGNVINLLAEGHDITAIKEAQESIEAALRNWTETFDAMSDGVSILDEDCKIMDINASMCKLLGKPKEAVIGKKCYEIFHGSDAPLSNCPLTMSKHSCKEESSERFEDHLGRWLFVRVSPIFFTAGNGKASVKYVHVVRDITRQKVAEESLREGESRFRKLFNASSVPMAFVGKDGSVIDYNERFVKTFGYTREDISTISDWWPLAYPDSRERVLAMSVWNSAVQKAVAAGTDIESAEYRITCKSGEVRTMLASGTFIGDAILVTFYDITERKAMEDQLRHNEEKYRSLIEHIPLAIFIKDKNSVYLSCNQRYADELKITPDEIRGKNDYDFFSKELAEKYRADDRRVIETGKTEGLEEKFIADGRDEWIYTVKTPYRDADGNIAGVLGIFRDVTEARQSKVELEQKNAALETLARDLAVKENSLRELLNNLNKSHEELKHMQRQLIQSEKLASIGYLAAGIAHEINNPLGYIASNLSVLEKYIGGITEIFRAIENMKSSVRQKDLEDAEKNLTALNELEKSLDLGYVLADLDNLLRESREGTDRIKKIVMGLKTFSRKEEGVRAPTDLNKVIEDTLNIVWNEIKYKADLKKEYGQIPPVPCNSQQIGQVFINILVNAVQAIKDKGTITVTTYSDDASVYVAIADTGEGIRPENMSKLFEPFFTTKEKGKGTGLGLSISNDIVRSHQGEIKVESEMGKGTKFTISFPIQGAQSVADGQGGKGE